jgi:hypothetical protein
MRVFDWICLVLAVGALLDAWRNGSLFARPRVQVEQMLAQPRNRAEAWLALLLQCAFCLSYHVPYLLLGLGALVAWACPGCQALPWALVYSLAATRASNLLDGLLPERLRYDKPVRLP